MNSELRKDCPMRHENGNCLPCGGFCTAVIDTICEAMHNAYLMGQRKGFYAITLEHREEMKNMKG